MSQNESLFFCAVGGSGMLPLALMMKARGCDVSGSDRSHDQKRTPERFAFIEKQGIRLFPQNGSGVTKSLSRMIVSTAVEKTVPDYQAALERGVPVVHRAALLAEIANAARTSIAIAGTSGKSTTTGIAGWVLHKAGANPTVINGATMKNFIAPDVPFASAVVGDSDLVVCEVDESDGSISQFVPTIAVLNNIALDHKSIEELRALFAAFIGKAQKIVINLDNDETAALAASCDADNLITYSLSREATLRAQNIVFHTDVTHFNVTHKPSGTTLAATLRVPGEHNIANALAAVGAAMAAGVPFERAVAALGSFTGIARRLDTVGAVSDITVIDDFAHNPDKIAASLRTLHQTQGRLLILFQPHGYGPLALMKDALIDCFADGLNGEDVLFLCDPLYLGGTTERKVTSHDITAAITTKGKQADYMPRREDCATAMIQMAEAGDRIVIMGARDDTLPELAKEILFHIGTSRLC